MNGRVATMQLKRPFHAIFLALIIWLCVASSSSAQDTRMLIDQVPIFPGFKPATPLTAHHYAKQQAALVKALQEQWKGKYRIAVQRFYIYKGNDRDVPIWVAFDDFVRNYFLDELHGEKEYHELTPTPEPIATVWRLGDQRFAIAESTVPLPDGSALCGYFQVEKEK